MSKNKPCDLPNLKKIGLSHKIYQERVNISKKKGYNLNPKTPNGKYLYIIRKSDPKYIFMIDKRIERKDYIYHNILAEDGNVLMSGEMEIKDNIISFDNNSGYYKPKKVCFNYLKDLMINEYGFKYVTTNEKQLKDFLKITMIFDNNLWEGRRKVIHSKSKKNKISRRINRINKRSKSKKSSKRSKRINKK
jgi:hypothetical protein